MRRELRRVLPVVVVPVHGILAREHFIYLSDRRNELTRGNRSCSTNRASKLCSRLAHPFQPMTSVRPGA